MATNKQVEFLETLGMTYQAANSLTVEQASNEIKTRLWQRTLERITYYRARGSE
jgi:hypothetical protein